MALPCTFSGTAGASITTLGFELNTGGGTYDGLIITASSQCRPVSNTSSGAYTWATDLPSSADYDVQADFIFYTNTVQRLGVTGRASTNANTFYNARVYQIGSSANVQLLKYVSGGSTQLGSNYAITPSGTMTIKLSMAGSSIKVYVDGVERIAATDTAITQVGRAGVYVVGDVESHADDTDFQIDNFTASYASAGAFKAAWARNSNAVIR